MVTSGWEQKENGLLLHCHIQPNTKKNEFARLYRGRIKIRLSAQPVDGKANKQLITFLAKELKVSKSQIEIVRGHTSREKTVLISGLKRVPANLTEALLNFDPHDNID